MNDNIFQSIKALLGPDASYEVFDQDILIHINMAVSTLIQLGIGPAAGLEVTKDTTWNELLGSSANKLNMARTYIYLKVKMIFDPPASSFVMSAYQEQCKEIEWRLNVEVDPSEINA